MTFYVIKPWISLEHRKFHLYELVCRSHYVLLYFLILFTVFVGSRELQYNSLADRQALEAEVAPLTLPSGAEFQKSLESLEKLGNDAGTPSRNRSTTHAVSPERKEMDPLAHSHWVLHQASREVQVSTS